MADKISKQKIAKVIRESFSSLIKLSDHILPHHKMDDYGETIPEASIHHEFDELLRGAIPMHRRDAFYNVLGILPRGTAKSTYAGVFFPIWVMLFTNKQHIVLIGAKGIHNHFNTLKEEVKNNKMLHLLGIKPDPHGLDNETSFDVIGIPIPGMKYMSGKKKIRISCFTSTAVPRGLKIGHKRPDLVIIDDLERKGRDNLMGVESPKYRARMQELFDATIVPSAFNARSMQIIMIGTIMHEDQLLNRLYTDALEGLSNPKFKAIKYAMIENFGEDGEYSIWPEKMSIDEFYRMLRAAERRGTQNIVFNEYLSLPSSPDIEIFTRDDFRYFVKRAGRLIEVDQDGDDINRSLNPVNVAIRDLNIVFSCDVAYSTNENADETAITVSGIDSDENVFIIDIIHGRWLVHETIKELEKAISMYKPVAIGIEDTGGGKVVIQSVEKELDGNPLFPGVTPLSSKGMKKQDRIINRLQIPYKQGQVFHLFDGPYTKELEHQILCVTREAIKCKHDDFVDSVSYVYDLIDDAYTFGYKGVNYDEDYYDAPVQSNYCF